MMFAEIMANGVGGKDAGDGKCSTGTGPSQETKWTMFRSIWWTARSKISSSVSNLNAISAQGPLH